MATKQNSEVAKRLIQEHAQRSHDHHVWRRILTQAQGWRDGTLNDSTHKHVADAFGFELEKPAFLDDLIAHIEKFEPKKD